MGALEGRVAIITGAGRGIGREHALLFAREGAHVVVNDLGGSPDGTGADASPAEAVVAEIAAMGGEAVANHDDVADAEGAARLVQQAIDTYGALHVLVNNAGILRDRMVFSMTDDEWDAVIRVHLRGHFMPTRAAAGYWRQRSKDGDPLKASVINTTSTSGLLSNPGQTNYGAAKTGIATFTEICQKELWRYGVRCNAIAPAARTRLTAPLGGMGEAPETGFDPMAPENISPMVAYLATEECPIGGKVFFVFGGTVQLFQPYTVVDTITTDGPWSLDELAKEAGKWGEVTFDQGLSFG
jgi:NAD(P)-dependent dehydrogenase (short-subunit alcohol dehydrogenase family)